MFQSIIKAIPFCRFENTLKLGLIFWFGFSIWCFLPDSIPTMLKEAPKDESVRRSAERPKGLREVYSKSSLCRWKIPGSRYYLMENAAADAPTKYQNDCRRAKDQLLFVIRCPDKSTMNVYELATPRLFAETRNVLG